MNGYKRILKNANIRYRILNVLNFIPDSLMIRIQYWIKLGRFLNLKKPQRYSEKIQKYKLSYRNSNMPLCANKWNVREYVKKKGFENILNENYGVYNSVAEIPFDSLPNQFVIKDTLGGGGTSVILVDDKTKENMSVLKARIQKWLDSDFTKKHLGREWVYDNQKHQIIIEKMLKSDSKGDLPDYKFFCFNGKVFCSYFLENYTRHHSEGRMAFLDRNFQLLSVKRTDFLAMDKQPAKPKNYEEMVRIAEALSEEFPHVRVDLYNTDGKIIFGEMTFFNASGYVQFDPDEFDLEMGKLFILK